ncbi:MAG: addiction module protein [Rhodospirillales bacterium]|nr:addiction module protein [Rhodospirillales bacterium]
MSPASIARLSPQERLALIADLWDSLGEEDLPLTPEQQAELDRRMAAPDDERSGTVDWSALRDELFRRLG